MPITIHVPPGEEYNRQTNEFIYTKEQDLKLEHSLLSISKWESNWEKPYLSKDPKTVEQVIDYIRCMTITKNVDPHVYYVIPQAEIARIQKYIDKPMTATTFTRNKRSYSRKIITSEVIYSWMVEYGIPFECEKWHLNRLMALIGACGELHTPGKKMSAAEIGRQNEELNRMRRARLHSKG